MKKKTVKTRKKPATPKAIPSVDTGRTMASGEISSPNKIHAFKDVKNFFVRRDPNGSDVIHYHFDVNLLNYPLGIPCDINPRSQKEKLTGDHRTFKNVLAANETSLFTNHRGIRAVATKVEMKNGIVVVNGLSIGDGGHSNKVYNELLEEGICPKNQWQPITITVGLTRRREITNMAVSLNTGKQVMDKSIANARGYFDSIKSAVRKMPYAERIAYRENESKRAMPVDVMSILSIMRVCDVSSNPDEAAIGMTPMKVLKNFVDNHKKFNSMEGIMTDLLSLSDWIHQSAVESLGERVKSKKMKRLLKFRKKGSYIRHFIGMESPANFYMTVITPMYGTLRRFVDFRGGKFVFRNGWTAEKIRTFYQKNIGKLVDETLDLNCSPDQVTKNASHWKSLYKTVEALAAREERKR